jgi:acyl-CoA hydrolase
MTMLSRLGTLTLPIGGNLWRKEQMLVQYAGPDGKLDFGRLLQGLDLDAADIASEQAGLPVVTIAVQGTAIRTPLELGRSYVLNKYVTNTHNKSLEVGIDILEDDGYKKNYVTSLYFAFAGWKDGKTERVRQATPQTPLEIEIAKEANQRKIQNLAYRDERFTIMTKDEEDALAQLKGAMSIGSTADEYRTAIRPGWENPHGYAYGGNILELMYDQARNHAMDLVSDQVGATMPWPLVATLNRATFDQPLSIGSLAYSEVKTIFIGETSIVQRVVITQHRPRENQKITNTGIFTFVARDCDGAPLRLPNKVCPATDEEIALWLEAYRHRITYLQNKHRIPPLQKYSLALLQE